MYQIDFNSPIHVHFIGIGGISMSGLALLLLSKGFQVSGSDSKESALTSDLERKGATIHIGQSKENLSVRPDVIVYTAAIRADNPEYCEAVSAGIPLLTRAELLGQVMKIYKNPVAISGTHGKTTTTSMVSTILMASDLDPTLSVGGILKEIGGNFRIGKDEVFVAEACEYTNSFLSFFPRIAAILNVEEDHLDFFKDLADIRNSFSRFAALLPEDGTLIINGNIENYRELTKDLTCRVITFGSSPECDYSFSQVTYDDHAHASFTLNRKNASMVKIELRVPGEHNIYNAMAAFAIADVLGISESISVSALRTFTGTDRRFEYKGTFNGITIIDDYAHHPTEIRATLTAARNYPHGTLWCIFQPHTYTRTKAFLTDFAKALSLADKVILPDIYAARETDTLGISSDTLRAELEKLGKECYYLPKFSDVEEFVTKNCLPNDLLITMGAGDVVKIGENLLSK